MSEQEYEQIEQSPFIDNSFLSYLEEKDQDYVLTEHNSLVKLRKISSKLHKNNLIVSSFRQAILNTLLGGEIKFKVSKGKTQKRKETEFLSRAMKKVDKDRDRSISQILNSVVGSAFEKGDVLINLGIDNTCRGDGIWIISG